MIGNGYWATGITVAFHEGGAGGGLDGWSAEVEFLDDGFCNDNPEAGVISTQGKLNTRYIVKVREDSELVLAAVIDAVKADAERLGIRFREGAIGPHVYYKGDGEWEDYPPPEDWRVMVDGQAERLGWPGLYSDLHTERFGSREER
jgi:hypothetical protein